MSGGFMVYFRAIKASDYNIILENAISDKGGRRRRSVLSEHKMEEVMLPAP